jgi:hypothetical protein
MKRFLLACFALAITACLPANSDPSGATLTLEPTATYNVLRFATGSADATNVNFEIAGIGTRVNDPKCKLEAALIKCDLGSVPVGKTYNLPIVGTAIQARATYARVNGATYEIYLK